MVVAHIWFSEPTLFEEDPWTSAEAASEHPPGYVVEVGGSQYHLGVKTLDEAKDFALSKGATDFYHVDGIEQSWAGRDDGDEKEAL